MSEAQSAEAMGKAFATNHFAILSKAKDLCKWIHDAQVLRSAQDENSNLDLELTGRPAWRS